MIITSFGLSANLMPAWHPRLLMRLRCRHTLMELDLASGLG